MEVERREHNANGDSHDFCKEVGAPFIHRLAIADILESSISNVHKQD
jgi:hypothetical protein